LARNRLIKHLVEIGQTHDRFAGDLNDQVSLAQSAASGRTVWLHRGDQYALLRGLRVVQDGPQVACSWDGRSSRWGI
jgi:hypothetical protein